MSANTALAAILRERGVLTAEIVVEEAAPEDHELHPYFTWDDAQAARERRLDQAQHLIRSVKVERVENEGTAAERVISVRAYISEYDITGEEDAAGRYVPVADVIASPFLRAATLRTMERDWLALKRKYEGFDEFADMVLSDFARTGKMSV